MMPILSDFIWEHLTPIEVEAEPAFGPWFFKLPLVRTWENSKDDEWEWQKGSKDDAIMDAPTQCHGRLEFDHGTVTCDGVPVEHPYAYAICLELLILMGNLDPLEQIARTLAFGDALRFHGTDRQVRLARGISRRLGRFRDQDRVQRMIVAVKRAKSM